MKKDHKEITWEQGEKRREAKSYHERHKCAMLYYKQIIIAPGLIKIIKMNIILIQIPKKEGGSLNKEVKKSLGLI